MLFIHVVEKCKEHKFNKYTSISCIWGEKKPHTDKYVLQFTFNDIADRFVHN